jgi:hypothetical protein
MTRKATAKKKTKAAKKGKKPMKPRGRTAYVVLRKIGGEYESSYTEPDRVFADKAAARRHADALNRELRAVTNPFRDGYPEYLLKGGEKSLVALVKKLRLTPPEKPKGSYSYIDWQGWWDRSYFDMTDAQRDAIWDALDKYDFYEVMSTTVE